MIRDMVAAAALLCLAALPAAAQSKAGKEGGPDSQAGMWVTLPGPREATVKSTLAGDNLGTVNVIATMWAGTGSAKCRVNFVVENYASVPIALGFVARTYGKQDEVLDNWVVTVAELPPRARTGRLFSCTLGAVEFTIVPTTGYDWPPLKCAKGNDEAEICPLTLKLNSTVPIIFNKQEKKADDAKRKH